jgi:hypothetical protein
VQSEAPGDAPPRKPGFHGKKFGGGKKKFGGKAFGGKKFGGKAGHKGKHSKAPA